jgi:hypothetical protein
MDLGLIVGIVGTLLTIVSLAYAVIITRQNKQLKSLCYETLSPVPIADAISKESGYSIRIIYERPDRSEESVSSIYAQYLRFTNTGKIPIKRGDLAPADPIRIEILGGKVLDISISQVTRKVCNVNIAPLHSTGETFASNIDFDFLDHMDGGLIQIITEDRSSESRLAGTIVGMPQGIVKGSSEKNYSLTGFGCLIPIAIFLLGLSGVSLLYRAVIGSWKQIWLLLTPFAALLIAFVSIIPLIILYARMGTIKFPKHLTPPNWYYSRFNLYHRRDMEGRKRE